MALRDSAQLTLYQFPETPVSRQPEGLVLSSYYRQTSFVGRETDLKSLQEWLLDPRPILSRTLFAPAGMGKTRLALELCTQAPEWKSGFARKAHLSRLVHHALLSEWTWKAPTLVIVDDASKMSDDLALLFESLSERIDRGENTPKLRILLLDRTASLDDGWFADVHGYTGDYESRIMQLCSPPHPLELPKLEADASKAIVNSVFKLRPDKPTTAAATVVEKLELSEDANELAGNPLFLQIAAYEVDEGDPGGVSRTPLLRAVVQLAKANLRKEWASQKVPNFAFDELSKLLAVMTLARRNEPTDLPDFVENFDEFRKLRAELTFDQIVMAFQKRPRPEIKLEPDLVGDFFTASCPISPQTVVKLYEADPNRIATRLWRWLGEFGADREIAVQLTGWIKAIANALSQRSVQLDMLIRNARVSGPHTALLLGELMGLVTNALKRGEHSAESMLTAPGEEGRRSNIASSLLREARMLKEAHHYEEALTRLAEAKEFSSPDQPSREVDEPLEMIWTEVCCLDAIGQKVLCLRAIDEGIAVCEQLIKSGRFSAPEPPSLRELLDKMDPTTDNNVLAPNGLLATLGHGSVLDCRIDLASLVHYRLVIDSYPLLKTLAAAKGCSDVLRGPNALAEYADYLEGKYKLFLSHPNPDYARAFREHYLKARDQGRHLKSWALRVYMGLQLYIAHAHPEGELRRDAFRHSVDALSYSVNTGVQIAPRQLIDLGLCFYLCLDASKRQPSERVRAGIRAIFENDPIPAEKLATLPSILPEMLEIIGVAPEHELGERLFKALS